MAWNTKRDNRDHTLKIALNVQKSAEIVVPVNRYKSHIARANATKNFKFPGFAYGKSKDGIFIQVHRKPLQEAEGTLRNLARRNRGKNAR